MSWKIFKIVPSAVGTVMGLSAFVAFLYMKNNAAAVWAVVVAILSAVTMHLSILNHRQILEVWYADTQLRSIARLTFAVLFFSIVGVAYHAAVLFEYNTPILPVENSEVVRLVFSILTVQHSLYLFILIFTYRRQTWLRNLEEEKDALQPNLSES